MMDWNRPGRPLLLAHRGACANAPENTLAAFQLALEQGADGIELDAKSSADGEIVVIHDPTVDRTTDGHGQVRRLTLRELRQLDAGSRFSPAFRGERIPTLDEVFETIGRRGIIDIEITNYQTPFDDLADKILQCVKRHGLEDWVFFSSFNPLNLRRVRHAMPAIPAGILAFPGYPGTVQRSAWMRRCSPELVVPYRTDIDEPWIAREHHQGRKVVVWTINQGTELARLIGWGVDGIITDEPMKMRERMNEGEAD